jgi:hypothetical protein
MAARVRQQPLIVTPHSHIDPDHALTLAPGALTRAKHQHGRLENWMLPTIVYRSIDASSLKPKEYLIANGEY